MKKGEIVEELIPENVNVNEVLTSAIIKINFF